MKRAIAMAWWLFGFGPPPEPKPEITPKEAYEAGFANGHACGMLKGRNDAVDELEAIVAARKNALFDADDVALVKQRTLH